MCASRTCLLAQRPLQFVKAFLRSNFCMIVRHAGLHNFGVSLFEVLVKSPEFRRDSTKLFFGRGEPQGGSRNSVQVSCVWSKTRLQAPGYFLKGTGRAALHEPRLRTDAKSSQPGLVQASLLWSKAVGPRCWQAQPASLPHPLLSGAFWRFSSSRRPGALRRFAPRGGLGSPARASGTWRATLCLGPLALLWLGDFRRSSPGAPERQLAAVGAGRRDAGLLYVFRALSRL